MKFGILLSFAAAVMAHCGGDNCARQVTGTRADLTPIQSRKADCSKYMTSTVTPKATTVTVTVTVDEDEDDEPTHKTRHRRSAPTNKPKVVPAYASSCQEKERYSSACACWGITAGVTTAPKPTSTVTVTTTIDYCEGL